MSIGRFALVMSLLVIAVLIILGTLSCSALTGNGIYFVIGYPAGAIIAVITLFLSRRKNGRR